MDVGFHFNFGLGWEGRGLVSGSLLFVIWRGRLLFYNFLGGGGGGWGVVVVVWGLLVLEFLGDKFNLILLNFLLKYF